MNVDQSGQAAGKSVSAFRWAAMVLVYLFVPGLLWLCAGTLRWTQGWVWSVLVFATGIGGRIWAELRHPGLMAERTAKLSRADIKPWDRVLSPLMSFTVGFPLVIVAGLDKRFGWTGAFPPWLTVAGLLLAALGYGFAVWALVENSFFSGVVRIQAERGHTVCDTGPYRIVRHPGYAGNLLAAFGMALGLGSLWGLLPAAAVVLVTVVRTALEDRALRAELPGYTEYASRVRDRLIPGVW